MLYFLLLRLIAASTQPTSTAVLRISTSYLLPTHHNAGPWNRLQSTIPIARHYLARRSVIRRLLLDRSTATHPRRDYRCYNFGSLFPRAHHRQRNNRCSSPALLPAVSRRKIDAPDPTAAGHHCTEHFLLSSTSMRSGNGRTDLHLRLYGIQGDGGRAPLSFRMIIASGQEPDSQLRFKSTMCLALSECSSHLHGDKGYTAFTGSYILPIVPTNPG